MASFLMFLLAVVWLLYQLFSQKPCPPGSRFDFEKSREDLASGIGVEEWERRKKKGYYYSTPEEMARRQKEKEVIPGVVDIERYNRDRAWYGIETAERRRKAGQYKYVIKMKKMDDNSSEKCLEKEAIPGVVDFERYEKDLQLFGWYSTEEKRKEGEYKHIIMENNDESGEKGDDSKTAKFMEIDSPQSEQQKTEVTEVEDTSKATMVFQIADNVEKNGSFLKNRCEQILESYGFENSNLQMRSDCWKLITYKSNRKYGLFLKLPNYRQYDMSSVSVFIYCLEAMCIVDLANVGKSFAENLQIENHFSKEDIKLEYAHKRMFLDFHEVSPSSYKMHGLQGRVYYNNQFYSIKCGIEILDDEEFTFCEFKDVFSLNETSISNMTEQNIDSEECTQTILQHENNFDSMDGHEFETFCADILRKNGYENVQVTRGSGDQGVDIIAYKDDVKYGIQCKCYSSDVGNKAVQEVFSGKTFYSCHVGVVLTNSYFTNAAIQLAKNTGIVLWDRDKLLKMIDSVNS